MEDLRRAQHSRGLLHGRRHRLEPASQADMRQGPCRLLQPPTIEDLLEMKMVVLRPKIGEAVHACDGQFDIRCLGGKPLCDKLDTNAGGICRQDMDCIEIQTGKSKGFWHDRGRDAEGNEERGHYELPKSADSRISGNDCVRSEDDEVFFHGGGDDNAVEWIAVDQGEVGGGAEEVRLQGATRPR